VKSLVVVAELVDVVFLFLLEVPFDQQLPGEIVIAGKGLDVAVNAGSLAIFSF